MTKLRIFKILTLFLAVLIGSIQGQNIISFLDEPYTDGVISCDDQPITLSIIPADDDSVKILVLEPYEDFGESPTGDNPADWKRFVDTLTTLGFFVDIVDSSADLSTLLPNYDVLILYGNPGRVFTSSELTAIQTFLSNGGGVLSVVRASAGDLSELDVHNPVLSLVGMSYSAPRTTVVDTLDVSGTHPIETSVERLTIYKPMPISASSSQQVIMTDGGDCIVAADSSLGGKIVACGEEHFFSNGLLSFGGIPVDWDAVDNKRFTLETIFWLSSGRTHPGCGLDTSASFLDIDGSTYYFSSPEFIWDGLNLTFAPAVEFWTSGTHSISCSIFDSCGHSQNFSFDLDFDVDIPRATLVSPPTGILISSGDTAVVFVQDYETSLDTSASYIVVDILDTFYLEFCSRPDGFGVIPPTGWSVGPHQICVHAEDSPDYCEPNNLDSCFTITMSEETLRVEIADVWTEGCSLVYAEVCVRSGDRYVKDLHLDNFAFYENGIQVFPPSLELLDACPSESAQVDIVLLLDFSTSMNDEVSLFFGSIPSFVAALGPMDYRISTVVFNGCPEQTWPDNGVWLINRTTFGSAFCSYDETGPDWWATDLTEFDCLYNAVVNDLYHWSPSMRGSGQEDQYGAIVRANENLDFRPDAAKVFILFTDERPIVESPPCPHGWGPDEASLDSIVQYCVDNDIIMLPVTPNDGEFVYAFGESPERAYYEGYYDLGPRTGGNWFYLWSDDYDSLAIQIGITIANLPCCYLFRYREEQFCRDYDTLVVNAFQTSTNFGVGDTFYSPPCPGGGEFFYPHPCGGITTCAYQDMYMALLGENENFAPVESTLVFAVNPGGYYHLSDDELSITNDTLHFVPSTSFNNGDTVCAALVAGFDSMGCPIFSDTCCFVVDLEPPYFTELYPPPDTVMGTTDFTASLRISDDLAGVRWSDVGNDNFEVFVNGVSVPFVAFSDHPYMNIGGFLLHNHDTVEICINDVPDDPTYDYCPPNLGDTCWQFSILILQGPIAQPILPYGISACRDQQIWLALSDSDGVDSSTIVLVVNSDTFTCSDSELTYRDDTLFFVPPENYWTNNETVSVSLIKADDIYGAELQSSPVSWQFYLDFEPPAAQMTTPDDSSGVMDMHQSIELELSDNLAGFRVPACTVSVDGVQYPLEQVLFNISMDSLTALTLFDPDNFDKIWLPGDTIHISAYLCDNPDTCGPNCSEFYWFFYLPPTEGCARMPNPYTPNDDNINDYCQFTFPGMYYSPGTIYIYDIHGVLVRKIEIDSGFSAKRKAIWNGKDSNGRNVPQGLYLYVIEVDGEVVCDGTVTVAR